jgi:hypothetical protein
MFPVGDERMRKGYLSIGLVAFLLLYRAKDYLAAL